MKREDYLMRLIEAFAQRLGRLLAQVLDLAESGNYAEAHDVMDQASRQLVHLSTAGVMGMPDEALLATLKMDRRSDWTERAGYLAFLLREDGHIYLMQGNEQAGIGRFLKSLHLLLAVIPEKEQTVINNEDIEAVLADLEEYELPGRTYAALMHHFESRQAFGKAEDILFDWLDAESALADLGTVNPIEIGIAFYERLLQLPDDLLIAGNLPRAEVDAGLQELLAYD